MMNLKHTILLGVSTACLLLPSFSNAQTGTETDPFNELFINDFVKLGNGSLFLSSEGTGPVENEIWTTNGPLYINPTGATATLGSGTVTSTGQHTIINKGSGNVGIGAVSLPSAKLELGVSVANTTPTAFRVTRPANYLSGSGIISNPLLMQARGAQFIGTYKNFFAVRNDGGIAMNVNPFSPALEGLIDVHMRGFMLIDGSQASLNFGNASSTIYGEWGIEYNTSSGYGGLNFWKPSTSSTGLKNWELFLGDDGKIGMGVLPSEMATTSDYTLYVAKGILTERVKVALRSSSDWADYVFADDYALKPLEEVEAFIDENQHLPGVPSAEEVAASGIDVASMDAKLLEKIEELTLYTIEQQKLIDALSKKIEELEQK